MWPRIEPRVDEPEKVRHDAVCSCGAEVIDTAWHDDVVLSDVAWALPGHPYVLAYPDEEVDQSIGGVFVSTSGDRWGGIPVKRRDLAWLLDQPGLHPEFRRAAAAHLRS
jgi:hypothetical protein